VAFSPGEFYDSGKKVFDFIKGNIYQKTGELSLDETVLTNAFNKSKIILIGFIKVLEMLLSSTTNVINFLFRYYRRFGEEKSKFMALDTLKEIANGGIRDHIGGGFHRYATDVNWRIPHFEKMLYDQAQLSNSYLDAFQITHEDFYSSIAIDILNFTISEMTSSEGGFYSAIDAEAQLTFQIVI